MKRLIPIILGFLIAAGDVQAATTTVKDGLKEAGWATVPVFLDAATSDITIKFPKEMGGGKLKFGGTIDAEELKNKTFVFTTLDDKKLKWDNAFGMSFLDLTDVAMTLKAAKGVFEITLDGKVGGPFKNGSKPREVIIELAVEEKEITNFALSLPDTSLHLSQISELKSIPGAAKMAFSSPTISLDAVGGKMEFKGETLDAVAFYDKALKSWNIGLNLEKPMTLGKLVGHNKGFLKDVVMPQMRILSSTKGLKGAYADLPLAMRQFFSVGGALPEGELELVSGINILTSFDPAIQPKAVKSGLSTIGIVQPVEIDGTVEGVFGGTPAVDLKVAFSVPADQGGASCRLFHRRRREIEEGDPGVRRRFRRGRSRKRGRGRSRGPHGRRLEERRRNPWPDPFQSVHVRGHQRDRGVRRADRRHHRNRQGRSARRRRPGDPA